MAPSHGGDAMAKVTRSRTVGLEIFDGHKLEFSGVIWGKGSGGGMSGRGATDYCLAELLMIVDEWYPSDGGKEGSRFR
jgi:hypothetical protein